MSIEVSACLPWSVFVYIEQIHHLRHMLNQEHQMAMVVICKQDLSSPGSSLVAENDVKGVSLRPPRTMAIKSLVRRAKNLLSRLLRGDLSPHSQTGVLIRRKRPFEIS